jgi:hypothetical protein
MIIFENWYLLVSTRLEDTWDKKYPPNLQTRPPFASLQIAAIEEHPQID